MRWLHFDADNERRQVEYMNHKIPFIVQQAIETSIIEAEKK